MTDASTETRSVIVEREFAAWLGVPYTLAVSSGTTALELVLAAWGIGATGKETPLYAALEAAQSEKDATKWTPAYANLVWKITPAAAAPAFAARASSAALARKPALGPRRYRDRAGVATPGSLTILPTCAPFPATSSASSCSPRGPSSWRCSSPGPRRIRC